MKVCVLFGGKDNSSPRVKNLAESISKGISSQGHIVDTFNMYTETGKNVSYYEYIVLVSESLSLWGGKIPEIVSNFLKTAGTVSGIRSSCFIFGKGFRTMKTLQTLMKTMEKEGMYLKVSDILTKPEQGFAVGKRLHIK